MSSRLSRSIAILSVLVMNFGCGTSTLERPAFFSPPDSEAFSLEGRPRVESIRITNIGGATYLATFKFSGPMDRESVEQSISLAVVEGHDARSFALGDTIVPNESYGFKWDSANETVIVEFSIANVQAVRPIVGASAKDTLDRAIDGTSVADQSDPQSLARSSDDGFNSAVTHIGLPFFTGVGLDDHHRFRLNNDRPTLELRVYSSNNPVAITTSTLDGDVVRVINKPAALELFISAVNNRNPNDPTTINDLPTYFGLDVASHINVVDALGVTVPTIVTIDSLNNALGAHEVTFASQDQFVGLASFGGVSTSTFGSLGLLLESTAKDTYMHTVEPVTGGVAFPAVLLRGEGRAPVGNASLVLDGQALRQDYLVGQFFVGGLLQSNIVGNNGNSFDISTNHIACTPSCKYEVFSRPNAYFRSGDRINLTSDTVRVIPTATSNDHPLPWSLTVKGGEAGIHDIYGISLFDGRRDGDEVNGIPDNDYLWVIEGASSATGSTSLQ